MENETLKRETLKNNIRNATAKEVVDKVRDFKLSDTGLPADMLKDEKVEVLFDYFKSKIVSHLLKL